MFALLTLLITFIDVNIEMFNETVINSVDVKCVNCSSKSVY